MLNQLIQEDVEGLLLKEGIIKEIEIEKARGGVGSVEHEISAREHTESVRKILRSMVAEKGRREPIFQGVTVALSEEMVRSLGEKLGVDAIVRGRIIEYGVKETKTLNPLQGIIPFVLGGAWGGTAGYATCEGYEGGLGPAVEGGVLGGFGMKLPASAESSIVQVRIYLQDARTGKLLWSNRAEVEYRPGSSLSYNARHRKTMFDKAVKEAIKSIMESLFQCQGGG